jgi:hypothetical protein
MAKHCIKKMIDETEQDVKNMQEKKRLFFTVNGLRRRLVNSGFMKETPVH